MTVYLNFIFQSDLIKPILHVDYFTKHGQFYFFLILVGCRIQIFVLIKQLNRNLWPTSLGHGEIYFSLTW